MEFEARKDATSLAKKRSAVIVSAAAAGRAKSRTAAPTKLLRRFFIGSPDFSFHHVFWLAIGSVNLAKRRKAPSSLQNSGRSLLADVICGQLQMSCCLS